MTTRPADKRSACTIVGSNKGIALLVVLWTLVILTAIVFSFSFLTRTETHATLLFVQSVEEKLLAEAGMERGIAEILRRGVSRGAQTVTEAEEPVKADGTLYTGSLGGDSYTYSVLEESGKINLNQLSDASGLILSNLLVNRGVSKEDADTIVDSILDWRDGDELVRLHGAESGYYSSRPEPYKSKNAPFDSVEELLMVRGVTAAILYGSEGRPGIFDLLTVYSNGLAINVNTAPAEVLAALPGMGTEMATAIMTARATPRGVQLTDLQSIAGSAYALMAPYVTVTESSIYTIEATGHKKGAKRGFTIRATLTVGADSQEYLYYKSPAGMKKLKGEGT